MSGYSAARIAICRTSWIMETIFVHQPLLAMVGYMGEAFVEFLQLGFVSS